VLSVGVLCVLDTQLTTGLLLAEVNAATLCELGNGGVSLTSMSARTLGRVGTAVSGVCYVLLHYALLVAYISRAGGWVCAWPSPVRAERVSGCGRLRGCRRRGEGAEG
jgi:amino acid permease